MLEPLNYSIAIDLFLRFMGLIYFVAIGAFLPQIVGLLGKEGILPISDFLKAIRRRFGTKGYYYVPTLFWLGADNVILLGTVGLGMVCAVLLMVGVATPWMLLILYILYLSIVSAGQDFLSFGWEMFLLEITANAFLLSLSPTNVAVWISLNILLFRFHLQAGAVKLLSRDSTWRDLTALAYHYQTQPLPNTQAWYAHKMPLWFQKLSGAFMFFIELAVPFGILFGNEWVRLICFVFLFGLQFMIWFTGNLSYLNHMTAAFCVILLSNTFLMPLFSMPLFKPTHWAINIPVTIAAITLSLLQLSNVWYHLIKPFALFQKISDKISPFHIINRYGIFAVMTTKRIEIVVEGSDDGYVWKEYGFKFKPTELSNRPKRISPFQPRLDWQMWFLPFSNFQTNRWFQNFLYRLLLGSPYVMGLLRDNPFPQKPPIYVRAVAYDYVFTTFEERKATGNWWKRQFKGIYAPVMKL